MWAGGGLFSACSPPPAEARTGSAAWFMCPPSPRPLRGCRAPFLFRSKSEGFCSALSCACVLAMPKTLPCRRRPELVLFRPSWCAACQIYPKGGKPKCTANEPPTPVAPFLPLPTRNRSAPKPIYVPVAQGNLALDRTKPLEEFAPAMRSTKRSAAKNSGATNSGTSVLSFFEQPIKPNDTKQQRLNKLVTRQAMEIKLLQKENEALRMENEIFKEATDKHASSLTKLQSKIKSLQRSLTNAQQPAKKKQRTMSTWLNNGSGGARQICVRGTPAPRALALCAPNGALRSSVPPRGELRARIASL